MSIKLQWPLAKSAMKREGAIMEEPDTSYVKHFFRVQSGLAQVLSLLDIYLECRFQYTF